MVPDLILWFGKLNFTAATMRFLRGKGSAHVQNDNVLKATNIEGQNI